MPLNDWNDLTPTAVAVVVDDSTNTWTSVVSGPDSTISGEIGPNSLKGRIKIGTLGNYILLDPATPVQEFIESDIVRLRLGDLGDEDYGFELKDHNGNSIMKLDGSGSNTLCGFTVDETAGIYSGTGETRVQMKAGEGIWCGGTDLIDAPFSANYSGEVVCTNIEITGGVIQSRNWAEDAGMQINLNDATITVREADGLTIAAGADILFEHGGDIKFTSVTAPIACTATLVEIAGNVDAGTHSYKITYVNDTGETELGAISNIVTADATHEQIDLTDIPISTSTSVTKRYIYRTKAGGSEYYFCDNLDDNTTTIFRDNHSDAGLGDVATNKDNSSFGKIYVDGIVALSLSANCFIGIHAGDLNTYGYKNTIIGSESFIKNTIGYQNTGIGYGTLYNITEGDTNIAIGYLSGYSLTTGSTNIAIGCSALYSSLVGIGNIAIGNYSGAKITSGNTNIAIGTSSLFETTEGIRNTALGHYALNNIVTGDYNIGIGFAAGKYETGSNAFYVNNQDRTNTAGDKTKSLLYGVMAEAAANQKLTINGLLNQSVSKTPSSASDTGTAGDICWDADFIYVCIATDTWKRSAISTW